MEKSEKTQKPPRIWAFFSSVKLTLALLMILAVLSICGTVIPQQEGAMEFAERLNPALVRLLRTLQVFDMYHSGWFRFIIAALGLNLLICSLDRFPTALRRFRAVPSPDRSKPFEDGKTQRSFAARGKLADLSGRATAVVRAAYGNVQTKETAEGHFIYGDKGRLSYFGVYLVHLSVLLILIGGIVGSRFGFEAFVNIPEGETAQTVALRRTGKPKDLGFEVQCNRFTVDFYPSGAPKEYRSDLTFLLDGKGVLEAVLRVNHPVTFRGITFYQSSYGTLAGEKARLTLSKGNEGSDRVSVVAEKGHALPLPGKEGQFEILALDPNLRGIMGPAVLVAVEPHEGEALQFWVFQHTERLKEKFPASMLKSARLNASAFEPYTFYLEEIESRYYTGIQVNRDPGVGFVWAGFFMIVIGLLVTFFGSHRQIWVRLRQDKGQVQVSVAGRANKNPVGLERALESLVRSLRAGLEA